MLGYYHPDFFYDSPLVIFEAMKYLFILIAVFLFQTSSSQSFFKNTKYSELGSYDFLFDKVVDVDGIMLGYSKFPVITVSGATNDMGMFYILDENLDIKENTYQVRKDLEFYGDLLTMTGDIYVLYNAAYNWQKDECSALKFNPKTMKYLDVKTSIFKDKKYDIFVKSNDEMFVCFISGSEVKVYDNKMVLVWTKTLSQSIDVKDSKSIALSNLGNLIVFKNDKTTDSSVPSLRVISKDGEKTSDALINKSYNLIDAVISLDQNDDIRITGYAESSSSQFAFYSSVSQDDLEVASTREDITDLVMSYQVKSKKKVEEYSDNLANLELRKPFVLEDGSMYLVSEIRNLDNRKGQYGNLYVSRFSSEGNFEWLKVVGKHQQENEMELYLGAVAFLKEDKLHLLHNDFSSNADLADGDARLIVNKIGKMVVFENEISTEGEIKLHLPSFSDYPNRPKRIILNPSYYYLNNDLGAYNYFKLNIQSGVIFKSTRIRIN